MCSEESSPPSLGYEIAFFPTELTSDTHLRVDGTAISLFMDDTIWRRFLQSSDSGKKYGNLCICSNAAAHTRFYTYIGNFCRIVATCSSILSRIESSICLESCSKIKQIWIKNTLGIWIRGLHERETRFAIARVSNEDKRQECETEFSRWILSSVRRGSASDIVAARNRLGIDSESIIQQR